MRRLLHSPWQPCWQPPGPPLAPGRTSVQQWRPWWPGPWASWAHLQRASAGLCIYWRTPGSRLWSGTGSSAAGTCALAVGTRSRSASPPGWRCPPCSSALALWTGPGTPLSSACRVSRTSEWTCCWETSQNCPAAPRKTLDEDVEKTNSLVIVQMNMYMISNTVTRPQTSKAREWATVLL